MTKQSSKQLADLNQLAKSIVDRATGEPTKETQLTDLDIDLILESLKYTKYNFENYQYYPSYEFKRSQLERVDNDIAKIKALRD